MKFWDKALSDLREGEHSLRAIYGIISERYGDCVFSERINGAETEKITYGQLTSLVDAIFCEIHRYGFGRGTFVGIDMPNSALWVACFWGVLKAGCRPLLINSSWDLGLKESVISDCRCPLVLSDGSSRCREAADFSFVYLTTEKELPEARWADEFALSTTGTTGTPKTVVHNGAGIVAQILCSGDVLKRNKTLKYNSKGEVKLLAFLPFYHIFGLVTNLLWFGFFGRTFVFISDNTPDSIRYACKRQGVTHFFAIPLVWNSVAKAVIREADRSGQRAKLERALSFSLRLQSVFPYFGMKFARRLFRKQRGAVMGDKPMCLISGGAPLGEDAKRVLNGMGYSVYNGYGLTEAGIVGVEIDPNVKKRMGDSAGRPFDGIQAEIIDGMLALKGGGLFTGTVRDGEVVYRNPDEPFITRDCARIDAKRRIFVCGRADDLVIGENGENVNPDDVERLIGVLPCDSYCVCGVKNGGKDVIALFIACTNAARAALAVKSAYEAIDRVPAYMRPSVIYLCGELPSVLGKIKRSELRKMFEAQREDFKKTSRGGELSAAVAATVAEVRECFAKVLNLRCADVSDNSDFMADLGGSSLDYFALVSELNSRFKISLNFSEDAFCVTPSSFAKKIVSETEV